MQKLNFNIYFIVPISHKLIPLNIMYGQKIIFEHFVMPWETGVSKQVNFTIFDNLDIIDVSKIKIINTLNKMPITIEIIKLNDIVQNISPQKSKDKKQIYLDTFLKATDDIEATVLKIIGLPNTVSVSHSYLCNGNLYVPKCDRQNSILSFDNTDDYEFKFTIEFFNTNITNCLCRSQCRFNNGIIETKIEQSEQSNISSLHASLRHHYEEICNEEFIQNEGSIPQPIETVTFEAALERDISTYSVIKIEGLPNNIDRQKYDIFHQDNAYYISNNHKDLYIYLLSQASNNTEITISYYNDSTLEPVLKNTFSYNNYSLQKIA